MDSFRQTLMKQRNTSFPEQLVILVALAAFAGFYLKNALDLGSWIKYGIPSASFLPIVLSALMLFGLVAEFINEVRRRRGTGDHFSTFRIDIYYKPIGAVLLTAGYVNVFARLGFEISTLLYVLALLSLFGFGAPAENLGRRVMVTAALALAITMFVYAFFVLGFGVQLPTRWVLF